MTREEWDGMSRDERFACIQATLEDVPDALADCPWDTLNDAFGLLTDAIHQAFPTEEATE